MIWLFRAIAIALGGFLSLGEAPVYAQPASPAVPRAQEEMYSWARVPLGSATFGVDPDRLEVERRLYMLSVTSRSLNQAMELRGAGASFRACTAAAIRVAATQLRDNLPKLRYPTMPVAETDAPKRNAQARDFSLSTDAVTTASLLGTIDAYRKSFVTNCPAFKSHVESLSIGLVDRVCTPGSQRCADAITPEISPPTGASQFIYGYLARWVWLRRGSGDWKSNQVWIIDDKGENSNLQTVAEIAGEGSDWPMEPAAPDKDLIRLVEKLRTETLKPRKIADVVPALLRLTSADFARILDVVDSPLTAQMLLPNVIAGAQRSVLEVNDELSRSRIRECSQFLNGNAYLMASAKDSPKGAAESLGATLKCAGIDFSAADIQMKVRLLTDCINGALCRPTINVDKLDVRSLAEGMFPRVQKLSKDLEVVGRNCGLEQRQAKSGPEMDKARACLLGAASPETLGVLKCFESKAASDKEKLGCVAGTKASSLPLAECVIDSKKSDIQRIECIAQSKVPALSVAMGCKGKANVEKCLSEAFSTAVTNKVLGANVIPGDLGRAAYCYNKYPNAFEAAECLLHDKLPPDVALGVTCLRNNNGNASSAANCMLLSKLPVSADMQKAAMCVSQSKGSLGAAGVCMISDGLTPEQRIAVQCAVSTGGAPPAFAVCAFGQLAMKELAQCADSRFAEDQCFGRNNEMRKLSRALGLGDIGPNSVVAAIANGTVLIQLKIAVAFVQSPEKGVQMAVNEVAGAVSRAANDIGSGVQHFTGEVAKAIDINGNGEIAKAIRFSVKIPGFR